MQTNLFVLSKKIENIEDHMLTCSFKSATGMDCPGCGFQRSFLALIKGNFYESIILYPALIPFIATVLLLILQLVFKKEKGGSIVMYSFITTTSIAMINWLVHILK